jgi:hypothetical protein
MMFRRTNRRKWSSAVCAIVVGAAIVAGTAGCSAVRESLGTSDSPCYVALPKATSAVPPNARFYGVRLLKVPAVAVVDIHRALDTADVKSGRVCLVGFTGHFTATNVTRPSGRGAGPFAVVVLTYPGQRLISTVVFGGAPVRFSHTHLGVH